MNWYIGASRSNRVALRRGFGLWGARTENANFNSMVVVSV